MIDGGVFGVSACARPAHWLSPAPVGGRGDEIGCASSPAVLERTRSLQLSSVGSCEPRKKPCDPSQTRRRFRIRLKPPSIQLAKSSPRRADPGYGYVYTWGESHSAFIRKSCAWSLQQKKKRKRKKKSNCLNNSVRLSFSCCSV